MIDSNTLRQKYLEFFKSKGHAIISSASLIPENDPTTLFTSSGMQPMVPYLLGETHPMGDKITDSQKSFRTVDIDEVGDNRHTTFFEMLGNWSLGSYFKEEQINWMWEFLIDEIGLNPERLYITCFRGDEDHDIPKDEMSARLWKKLYESKGISADIVDDAKRDGMQNGRIFYYDVTKNWWSRAGAPKNMPVGEPGGPDSEMFWDFGEHLKLHEKSGWADTHCHVNCDCGRFIEIGNNVFMAYKKTEQGFEELKQKNVDFGGGLERMAMALLDDPDIFKIDLFIKSREILEKISHKKYTFESGDLGLEEKPECWEKDVYAFRVILDHVRAATFLIADGAVPSNKDQGYFTRRLIRRAVRYGNDLGIRDLFIKEVALGFIDTYKDVYSDLVEKQDMILGELEKEEEKFRDTLEKGLKEFDKLPAGDISGEDAFILFSTYGFPIELIVEMAEIHGFNVDIEKFNNEMKQHQELSRKGAEQKFKGGLADHGEMSVKYHTATHLLHDALRKILGDHVEQKGSNITADRLRFDFTHSEKMTDEEKKQVEDLVNEAIGKNLLVSMEEMTVEEAKAQGAIGLFGDKYGEKVKVYTIGESAQGGSPFSREICGGPHVERTGELGKFRIKKEESSSAGVRRIKAVLE